MNNSHIPSKNKFFYFLQKVRKLLDSQSDDDILAFVHPDNKENENNSGEEEESSLKMKVIVSVIFFLGMRQKHVLYQYTMLSAIETSLTQGLSPYTASTFCSWGMTEMVLFGNVDRACRLAKLAQ
eukprot:CAMPEP_0194209642 /NCGR_PEP_ID=MMETSP0156-20130528/7696_1 /TAXON_ID=33649 /ORGANISM="Thalassionema nitzschioides, Strain L26-B" /LENGTH=124 /DNA_ID=CAMNT_0038936843 /DNA_START=476 /DNA_END=847 /DNA_ORIENTATION=-